MADNGNGKRHMLDEEAKEDDSFDFEETEIMEPKSNSAKKKKKKNVERILTLVHSGVLFSLPGDDAFGHDKDT